MKTTWQQARRRLKQGISVAIFLTLLLGASGTVFSVVSSIMSHLGTSVPSVQVAGGSSTVGVPSASGGFNADVPAPTGLSGQQPALEYSNPAPTVVVAGNGPSPDPEDAANSALAAAMDTGGVYVGQKVSHVFGSVLKSVLNALFLNTN
ncbi:hypothetical protein [Alicyclobacillus vulcanalis]|uniref:Uncharacterized protein n=1 Tax=Alicyclobacillus vulcanalis TaxID=252246 RepID=A0A1N7KZD5_9BACL|nr:hypothetical protein [Alicyclobacillus vulcanalis]SIS67002.1 hypothetical protein SAMN05421799_102297 [Alicyclobacillus vulcanalis]